MDRRLARTGLTAVLRRRTRVQASALQRRGLDLAAPDTTEDETMTDTPTPNLTGAAYLTTLARDGVAKAKERIAKATARVADASARHANASGQLEGVAAVMEQEAADLEAAVKEMLPGSNSGGA